MKKVPKSKCFIVPQLHPLFVFFSGKTGIGDSILSYFNQDIIAWGAQHHGIGIVFFINIGIYEINSIFLQPRYYCLKGSTSTTSITQHRNSLPRWMTFLSLDSLNESPFFGTVLHNQFLMGKLWKEYILTLSMKSKSNPCPTVIDSTLISTFLTMKVSKLHKKVKKLAFIKSSSGDERYFRRILYKPETMYP